MTTCTQLNPLALGLQRSLLTSARTPASRSASTVSFTSSLRRSYTSSSSLSKPPTTTTTTTATTSAASITRPTTTNNTSSTSSGFVQNPAFKSTSSLNQSRHSPSFKTQTTQLPNVTSRTPLFILLGILGVGFWAGSIAVAANHQRQGTSIVRGTLFNVKYDTKAQELLGDNIDFTNKSWPWISGTVAHLKGRVDIEYQVRGDRAEGRVHFVAVRPANRWVTTDFTLTMPNGTCVPLGEHTVLPELDL